MDKSILLVEDHDSLRYALGKLLEQDGYKVISCESTIEARRKIKKNTPDLIISDYNLEKDNNGVDLCCGIRRSLKRDIPVIIMSGKEQNKTYAKAKSFEFLKKTFEFHELNKIIRKCFLQDPGKNRIRVI